MTWIILVVSNAWKILLLLPNLPGFTRGHHLLFQGTFESEPESQRNLCSIQLESSLPLPWNPFLQWGNLWKSCRKNSLQKRIDSFSNLYFLFRCSVPLILHFILHFDPKHGHCWIRGRVTSKGSNSKHSIEDIIPYSTINQWDHCLRKVSRIRLVGNKKLFWMREVITNITNTVKAAWY